MLVFKRQREKKKEGTINEAKYKTEATTMIKPAERNMEVDAQ